MKTHRIILVRHGQSEHNAYGNSLEFPIPTHQYGLTELGHQQALACGRLLRESLGDAPIYFIVSDYVRTRQTAEGILQAFRGVDNVHVQTDPMVRENQRQLSPKQVADFQGVGAFYRPRSDDGHGEMGAEVSDRASNFLTKLKVADLCGEISWTAVVVTHANFIKALLGNIYGAHQKCFDQCDNPENADPIYLEHSRYEGWDGLHPYLDKFRELGRAEAAHWDDILGRLDG